MEFSLNHCGGYVLECEDHCVTRFELVIWWKEFCSMLYVRMLCVCMLPQGTCAHQREKAKHPPVGRGHATICFPFCHLSGLGAHVPSVFFKLPGLGFQLRIILWIQISWPCNMGFFLFSPQLHEQ